MVAATKAPMAFVDTSYIIRETNQAYLDMAGKERSEMVGYPVAKLVGERHFLDFSKPDLDRCFAGESINAQRWAGYLAGGKRYVDVHCDPSRDEKGDVRGAVVSFRDITEQNSCRMRSHKASDKCGPYSTTPPRKFISRTSRDVMCTSLESTSNDMTSKTRK